MPTLFKLLPKAVFLISFVFCSAFVFAEDITITTYYPSPYGVYNELQFYPHDPAVTTCDDAHKGTMYYRSTDDQVLVCKGTTLGWKMAGGGDSVMVLTGTTVSACPGGWTEANYAQTGPGSGAYARTCYRTDISCQTMTSVGITVSACPGGWTEANYAQTGPGSGAYARTCYRCN